MVCRLALLAAIVLTVSVARSQEGLVEGFEIEKSDIALERLAQSNTPFDCVGRKFAILGAESGVFEAWAYPLKLFRNFELSFFIANSTEPIRGRDIVRFISVSPEATILTYTAQSFTVRSIVLTPVNEPGALLLLEIDSSEPYSSYV